MTTEHSQLWSKLERLDLDGEAQLSFSRRLARDNGWTPEFARRVVDEYKRFVFLAATAGHPVTPSDEVDQAWHLHMIYTRSYWEELCGEVLGFPLHHGPTKGGRAEGAKFGDWYARTLESYRRSFGEEAPRDIWPEATIRFGEAPHYRRVNTKRTWVIRKPAWVLGLSGWKARSPRFFRRLAPVALLLLLAGCAAPTTLNVSQWNGAEFLGVFWTLCALVVAGIFVWRQRGEAPFDATFPLEPLNGYEVARLKDGGTLATDVAIAVLHNEGAVEAQPNGTLRATGAPVRVGAFEQAVLQEIRGDASPVPGRAGLSGSALGRQIEAIDQKLQNLGLLLSPEARRSSNTIPLSAVAVLVVIAVIRVLVGLARQRPVGFLVLSIAALIGYAIYLWATAPRRSKRGDLLLRQIEAANSSRQTLGVPTGDVAATALFFAVAGASAFPPPLSRVLWPSSGADGGSSSDSGGDSGGGDGGGSGCGGCGGCGGGGGD